MRSFRPRASSRPVRLFSRSVPPLVALGVLSLAFAGMAVGAPSATAVRLETIPVIDGVVLDDTAWKGHPVITGFTQQTPVEGAPATEKTVVFVGFTDTDLYIAFVCHDNNPDAIVAINSGRDANLGDSDSVRVVLDPFQSGQSGLVFGTNPTGLEYDGQVSNEQSSRFGFGGFDLSWDTSWQVEATSGEFGWSAEMRIPFTSLRYGSGAVQSWGMNFQRDITRTNETLFWSPLPRQFGINRLTLAGSVAGVSPPPQRSFQLTPYALGSIAKGGTLPGGSHENTELGFDAKYQLTPSLTLDMTYNTDFAQVEVDQQQVNLNRFSLLFPEKRPFFLENQSQFSVGTNDVQLFFSRRIGIADGGEPLPIQGGARLSGKVGDGTNVGVLAMRSEEVAGVASANNFAVARVRQEMGARSSLGFLAVNRTGGGTNNQTYAVDGRWGIGETGTVSGFAARTVSDDSRKDEHAVSLSGGYDSSTWSWNVRGTEVGEGFNPEVGFLFRSGYRHINVFALRSHRPTGKSSVLEYRPHGSYSGYWGFDGFHETGRLHLDSSMEFKNGASLHTAVNHAHEGVRADFEITEGVVVPRGKYDDWEFSMFSGTDRSANLRGGLNLQIGGFFGGDRVNVSPFVGYRIGESFEATLSYDHNDIDLPGGQFDVALTRLRLGYSISPKMSVAALIQHNDRDEVLSTNFRFTWLQSANAGLYIVYNETDDELNAPGRPRREFVIKYSYIFNVL
jgi:hypothetical protein